MSAIRRVAITPRTAGDNAGRTLCRSRRAVPFVIQPEDINAVRAAVRVAATKGTAIHPISTGKNWGYGSSLPARDGSAIMDLSRLRAIGPVDRDTLSVRIETGVTQKQLYDYLCVNSPSLWCNVTGAGADTAIIGNALERGIGYAGEREDELYAFEVVLADGTLYQPDREWSNPARAAVGLKVDALWPQTNLGIVVAARVRLRLRQEREDAVILQGPLDDIVAVTRRAWEEHLFNLPVHIGEPGRTSRVGAGVLARLSGSEPTAAEVQRVFPENKGHSALCALHGRATVVNAAWRELRGMLPAGVTARRANHGRLKFASRLFTILGLKFHALRLRAIEPLLALTWGVPSDIGLTALDQAGRLNPDNSLEGAIYLNAISAPKSESAKTIERLCRESWANVALTRIVVNAHCMLSIITVHFSDEETPRAHAAASSMADALRIAGFPPYRLGINVTTPDDALTKAIKQALDPRGIIAPGRYSR